MWQCLETKARFINQVMNGSVTVRQAEDLEGGALTYAEIKAIASGNPAVMEKVKVDTEIRKLDQLRASHINQQYKIRSQVRCLPEQIERSRQYHAGVSADIATRDAHAEEDFTMRVGNRDIRGKGAREDAGNALNAVVISWRNDNTPQVRAHFKGFDILSRGGPFKDSEPELYVHGKETYRANLNPENPLGTIQSIEHAPCVGLDRLADNEQQRNRAAGESPVRLQAAPTGAHIRDMRPALPSFWQSRRSLTPRWIWTSTRVRWLPRTEKRRRFLKSGFVNASNLKAQRPQ